MTPILYFTIASIIFVVASAFILSYDNLDASDKVGSLALVAALSVFWIFFLPLSILVAAAYRLSRMIKKARGD